MFGRRAMALLCAIPVVFACGDSAASTSTETHRVHVAVAANFAEVHRAIAEKLRAEHGIEVITTTGSTGTLFAQIVHGAPVEVFLAADRARPEALEEQGLAVVGSRFTYARGRLALVGAEGLAATGARNLEGNFTHLAIANPETAPYGVAAMEVLRRLHLEQRFEARLVRGANIAQAFQFVATGAADLGLVALSQVLAQDIEEYWPIPAELHEPVHQDAVLLERGASSSAARTYLDFLRAPRTQALIEAAGYAAGE